VVLADRSAAESPSYQVKDLRAKDVLTDSELWHELPFDIRARVPLDRHMKTTFSIDEARDVRIQPFLLIDRICRIFTVSNVHARNVHSGCITTF